MVNKQINVLNTELENEAVGHIDAGLKTSGKPFFAKLLWIKDDVFAFECKDGFVIFDHRSTLSSLRVVV